MDRWRHETRWSFSVPKTFKLPFQTPCASTSVLSPDRATSSYLVEPHPNAQTLHFRRSDACCPIIPAQHDVDSLIKLRQSFPSQPLEYPASKSHTWFIDPAIPSAGCTSPLVLKFRLHLAGLLETLAVKHEGSLADTGGPPAAGQPGLPLSLIQGPSVPSGFCVSGSPMAAGNLLEHGGPRHCSGAMQRGAIQTRLAVCSRNRLPINPLH